MFTGLVEDMATLRSVRPAPAGGGIRRYRFEPSGMPSEELSIGESVAVDGCCLTVVAFDSRGFEMEASPETLAKTTLGVRRVGDKLNLERALSLGDRLGGHLVSGHVDATGTLTGKTPTGEGAIVEVSYPAQFEAHLVEKGSITVDGVSLTVNTVAAGPTPTPTKSPAGGASGAPKFTVFLIPHTLQVTTLGLRRPGDRVNLETDLLGKYVLRALSLGLAAGPEARSDAVPGGVDRDFLRQHGWL